MRREPAADGARYWPFAELLRRTFQLELLCPTCNLPMKLVCLVKDEDSIARFLRSRDETTEAPPREPARGPPYFRSKALRRLSDALAS